jgi:hypothetical protein
MGREKDPSTTYGDARASSVAWQTASPSDVLEGDTRSLQASLLAFRVFALEV